MDENDPLTEPSDQNLQDRLERGAEPFWMQDIRAAARRLEAARRARQRPDHSSGESIEL